MASRLINALVVGLVVGIVVALIVVIISALLPGVVLDPKFWGVLVGLIAGLAAFFGVRV